MDKILYVADSRVSNTPVCLDQDVIDEVRRRVITLSEDYCLLTTQALSIERIEMIRKILNTSEEDIRESMLNPNKSVKTKVKIKK